MINSQINEYIKLIRDRLNYYVKNCGASSKKLIESVLYSLLPGGKFLRSLLTLDFCNLCNGNIDAALPFACSIEMIHTYSLIHDDLPCMDNDPIRRGKPSNHLANGEDFAVLSGDALFSLAIETLTLDTTVDILGTKKSINAIKTLVSCCGISGMVDGQALEIEFKNVNSSVLFKDGFNLNEIYLKKTGKLFAAACELGCIAAGASKEKTNSSKIFGETIGIAYQILDDLEDKELSKESVEISKGILDKLIKKAIDLLKIFDAVENSYAVYLTNELKIKASRF